MTHTIPATMRAVQLDGPSSPLTVREVPVPRPQAGQVLVRMAAAPINPSDLSTVSGAGHSFERTYPFTPGIEGSGVVVAAGAGFLPNYMNNRRVACSGPAAGNGSWAEYMLTDARKCVPLKPTTTLEQGAMLLVNPLSALAIFEIAKRGKHRAIVSTAAASALGTMILRYGKRQSIPVIHVVRRQEQVDLVRTNGGEFVINSSDADFVEQLHTVAQKLNATLLLDAISGEMTQQLAEAAPQGSTILMYSRLSGDKSVIDARTAFIKGLHFHGWFLSNWLAERNLLQRLQTSQRAQSLLATDFRSPIFKCVPLEAAQQSLEAYKQDMTAGKYLLVTNAAK